MDRIGPTTPPDKFDFEKAQLHVKECRDEGGMIDVDYNRNGVRRLAVPVTRKRDEFYGVLALAETSLDSNKDTFHLGLGLAKEMVQQWMNF